MNRKEALELLGKWYLPDETKEILEVLIPELAVSDDEKIIRAIIGILKNSNAIDINVSQEKMVAWLEKQKEQNKITIEQVYKEFINPEKLKDAKTNKYIRAQLLWELMHNGIITEVDYQYLTDDKRKPWTEEEYLKAYRKGFDVSEQLKQKEQEPIIQDVESCEPDTNVEKVIEDVIRVYGKTQGEWVGGYDVDTLIVNLRRAFNKKEQKPAEWSEEDRRTIDRACIALRAYANGELPDILPSELLGYADRLQSLRPQPHWKPSEEQKTAGFIPEGPKGPSGDLGPSGNRLADFLQDFRRRKAHPQP